MSNNPGYSIVEGRGSTIDPEATGPFPPNRDGRQDDIFLDQEERLEGRRSEAESDVGDFNQPQAFDVSPPPPMPTIDLGQPASMEDLAAEAARAAINDALRNMTINGVSPDISGGNISFDIPVEPSASTSFAAMNAEPNIAAPPIDTPPIVEAPPIEPPPVAGPPQAGEPAAPPTGTGGEAAPTEAEPIAPQPTPTEPAPEAPQGGDVGGGPAAEPAPVIDGEEPQADTEAAGPSDQEDEKPKEDREGFDLASKRRQEGEMRGEYEARMKDLREKTGDETAAKDIQSGDLSYLNSGYLNVLFTRKDGNRKILVQVDNANAAVIEGAVAGERTTTLPPDNAYYEAGGGGDVPPHPWQITIENQGTTSPEWKYKIEPASKLFDGFGGTAITVDGADGVFRSIETGFYILKINFSSTGTVEQAQIDIDENFGNAVEFEGTQTVARIQIGYIYIDEDGAYKVLQNAFHNFVLYYVVINGALCKIPFAS